TKRPSPAANVSVDKVGVIAHLARGMLAPGAQFGRIDITIERPVISVVLPKDEATKPSATAATASESGHPLDKITRDFAADLTIKDATFDIALEGQNRRVRASPLHLELNIPSLKEAWTASVT